jgi:hypothetical protein
LLLFFFYFDLCCRMSSYSNRALTLALIG